MKKARGLEIKMPDLSHIIEPLQQFAVEIDKLKLDPNNVRRRTERNLEAIKASLQEYGQRRPLIVNEKTGIIEAGNGNYEAAVALGWKYIAAVYVKDDPEKAAGFAIADNRTAELSEWDDEALLKQLQDMDADELPDVGFTEAELQDLLDKQQHPFDMFNIDPKELRPHPRNYQSHTEDQLDQIIKSITEHGFYRNIVISKDNYILAGHGVISAAIKMGRARVPVIRLDVASDDPRALKVLISDNEISNLATVDDRALTEMLKEIMELDVGIDGTGFNDEQLAALLYTTRTEAEIKDKDTAKEWVGMPEFIPNPKPLKIVISFDNENDRAEFMEKYKIPIGKMESQTWSTWYPYRDRVDLSSVKFE